MMENAELIIQLLMILSLLLYLNQKRLQREIQQLQVKSTEFLIEEDHQKPIFQPESKPPATDFAKRLRSNGKIWQPSLQQQQKALIENIVEDDLEEEEEKPKKKKKSTPTKSKSKSGGKGDKENSK